MKMLSRLIRTIRRTLKVELLMVEPFKTSSEMEFPRIPKTPTVI